MDFNSWILLVIGLIIVAILPYRKDIKAGLLKLENDIINYFKGGK